MESEIRPAAGITHKLSNKANRNDIIVPDLLIDFGGANELATPKRCEKIAR
jgi:hypothetical protein